MSLAKLAQPALACGLLATAVAACGITAKPLAGTPHIDRAPGNHAQVDDPRTRHVKCLRSHGFSVRLYRASGGRPAFQIGTLPTGPTVIFDPTPGAAQYAQIDNESPGAEVIGAALLYPNADPSDSQLSTIEGCVALGVTG